MYSSRINKIKNYFNLLKVILKINNSVVFSKILKLEDGTGKNLLKRDYKKINYRKLNP
jgi:hypothetical protein